MKALIVAVGMALMLGGQAIASSTSSEEEITQKQKTESREILSPELDMLFDTGNLGETIVEPMYSKTDQLINTEILKKSTQLID